MSGSPTTGIDAYHRAIAMLLDLIRGEQFASRNAAERRRRAEERLARIRTLLSVVGDPHRRYPVVHITGTSGKGSTAAAVAAVLTAAGYRVGLRTSPYLQVATEKLQIGPSLIDAESFERMVAQVLTEARRLFPSDKHGTRISYAEAWAVLGYWWFAERQIDIAVVEVGAGGRFDATNVIDPIVSVITSVGLDHVVTLGPTIADIAWHKAGIINPGAPAVIGEVPDEAFTIIASEAAAAGVSIVRTREVAALHPWLLSIPGEFQRRNAEVAATAAETLRQRAFAIPEGAIEQGIMSARLPARLERMPCGNNPVVWIDGAHNADKIAALADETARLSRADPCPVIVLGLLAAKNPAAIVAGLIPVASSMVLTEPTVFGKRSLPARWLAEIVTAAGFQGGVFVEPDPFSAVQCAEVIARARGAAVLVTGSLYLAGQVRRRWYRDEDIVLQRTVWPTTETCLRAP